MFFNDKSTAMSPRVDLCCLLISMYFFGEVLYHLCKEHGGGRLRQSEDVDRLLMSGGRADAMTVEVGGMYVCKVRTMLSTTLNEQ